MINKIKRPYIATRDLSDRVNTLLSLSIFPSWFEEVRNPASFSNRFMQSIINISETINDESLIVAGKSVITLADSTKPYYAGYTNTLPDSLLSRERLKLSKNLEDLYSDIFRYGYVEDEITYNETPPILKNRQEDILATLDIDNIINVNSGIKSILEEGETILSGSNNRVATTHGRVLNLKHYDNLRNNTITTSFAINNIVESPSTLYDEIINSSNLYIKLPLLTDIATIEIYNYDNMQDDGIGSQININIETLDIKIVSDTANYNNNFDADNDGYISNEDIIYISSLVGKTINNTSEDDWHSMYDRLDSTSDGKITESDVSKARLTLGSVLESCLLLKNITGQRLVIKYKYFIEPYIVYAGKETIASGISSIEEAASYYNIDYRISSGYHRSSSNVIVGFNAALGEIWAGRESSNTMYLNKVVYEMPNFIPVAMCEMDDIILFVMQQQRSSTGKRSIKLLRIDSIRERIEYTNDIIPTNLDIDINSSITGCTYSQTKDRIYLFDLENNIYSIRLGRNAIVEYEGGYYLSDDLSMLIPVDKRLPLYNDIDTFAYNIGLERFGDESNTKLIERIKEAHRSKFYFSRHMTKYGIMRELNTSAYADVTPIVLQLSGKPDMAYSISIKLSYRERNIDLSIPISDEDYIVILNDLTKRDVISIVNSEVIKKTYPITIETKYLKYNDVIEEHNLVLGLITLEYLIRVMNFYFPERLLELKYDYNKSSNHVIDQTLTYDDTWFDNVTITVYYTAFNFETNRYYNIIDKFAEKTLPTISSIKNVMITSTYNGCLPESVIGQNGLEIVSMYEDGIKEIIGEGLWNDAQSDIVNNNTSSWEKTIMDLTAFDDAFRTNRIVNKAILNGGDFDYERVEVEF